MSNTLIYLIAGEPSGDALGASLMRGLKTELPQVQFSGIGGDAMQHEGLHSLFPFRELSIMGFLEVLPHLRRLLQRIKQTHEDIAQKQPAAVITIDSPGFNFRLAAALKADARTSSIKRIHYVAPSVWAYKPQRAAKTARLFDHLLTLLPFEPPYFEKEGLSTTFVGHPVLWQDWSGDAAAFRQRHTLSPEQPILLLLPGSREGEIKKHLPIFLQAAASLPHFRPVVLAGSLVKESLKALLPSNVIVADIAEKKDAFSATSIALSKSGTVTLELAAAGVPMIVAHRVNSISAALLRRLILIRYVSLVNIAMNEAIVPEFLQERCTVAHLTEGLLALSTPEAQQLQRSRCAEAITILRAGAVLAPDVLAAKSIHSLITE